MKTIILKQKHMMFLALLICSFSCSAATALREAVLDEVDVKSQTLVVAGQMYKYKLNRLESQYDDDQDKDKVLRLSDLKKGQSYFFSFYQDSKSSNQGRNNETIILVSSEEPAE